MVLGAYYQFSNHRLADYFALRCKVRAGDFGVTKVYDPETDEFIPVEPNHEVRPVVEALPMGWSLDLHICTDALEHAVRIAGPCCDLDRERREAPLMTVAEPVCSVYVDNTNVHGITSESCDRRHEVIIAALEARGFSLHEVSRASQHHQQPRAFEKGGGFRAREALKSCQFATPTKLGVCFDGIARVLRHDPRRLWRVNLALRCLLRMGGARPWSCAF